MKNLLIFKSVLFLISFNAFSLSPIEGDWVSYNMNLTYKGESFVSSFGKKIIKKSDEEFLVKWNTSYAEAEEVKAWIPTNSMIWYFNDLEQFCDLSFGDDYTSTIENLKLSIGTFKVCRVEHNSKRDMRWYSNKVPFGLVKEYSVSEDGNVTEITLATFGRKKD